MPAVTITFNYLIQDSQDLGFDDEHMVSRVVLGIQVDGRVYTPVHVDVKQAVGEPFDTAPLEVGRPQGYDGPLDYGEFQKSVEAYYRDLVGRSGSAIHVEGEARVRMRNNRIAKTIVYTQTVPDNSRGW